MGIRFVSVACAAAFFVLAVGLNYPGMINPDSASQLWQARNWGELHDWHPPIISAIWALIIPLWPSPGNMLLLQSALFAFAIYNFVPALATTAGAGMSRWRASALAGVAVAFAPMALLAAGFIAKDSLMTGFFLAATALCLRTWTDAAAHTRIAAAASLLLLVVGALCRTNGFVPAMPLAALWLWTFLPGAREALDARRWRGLFTGAGAALSFGVLLLALTGPINNGLLGARQARALDSLLIFDLAGITRFSGENQFERAPSLRGALDGAEISACYSPAFWDGYRECGPVYPLVSSHGAQGSADLRRAWGEAVAAQPFAYLRHRAGFYFMSLRLDPRPGWHFGDDVIFITERFVTNRPGGWEWVSPEMTEGVEVWRPHTPARALQGLARKSVEWLLQGPALWLLASLALLGVSLTRIVRGRPLEHDLPLLALAASGAANSLVLFFIGVHDASRYHMWTFFVAMLAALMLLARAPLPLRTLKAPRARAPSS